MLRLPLMASALSASLLVVPQTTSAHEASPKPVHAVQLNACPKIAIVAGEPGSCNPPCRSGYVCKKGTCVSACNPACPAGQHCVQGECEPLPRAGEPTRFRYVAVLGGVQPGLNDSATTLGNVRFDIGGRYAAFQIGAGFGDHTTALRGAVLAHIFLQPWKTHPFFVVPRLGIGYSFNWIDAPTNPQVQNLFVTPSVRLRYDLKNRIAIFLDPVALGITFLRFGSSDDKSLARKSGVPVHLGLHLGIALLY